MDNTFDRDLFNGYVVSCTYKETKKGDLYFRELKVLRSDGRIVTLRPVYIDGKLFIDDSHIDFKK